jgi:hypothetical protein
MIDFSSVLKVDTATTSCFADAAYKEVTRWDHNGKQTAKTLLWSREGWRMTVDGVMLVKHAMPWLTEAQLAWLNGNPGAEWVCYTYTVEHTESGRVRTFEGVTGWGEVEAILLRDGLDPDGWAITRIEEEEA